MWGLLHLNLALIQDFKRVFISWNTNDKLSAIKCIHVFYFLDLCIKIIYVWQAYKNKTEETKIMAAVYCLHRIQSTPWNPLITISRVTLDPDPFGLYLPSLLLNLFFVSCTDCCWSHDNIWQSVSCCRPISTTRCIHMLTHYFKKESLKLMPPTTAVFEKTVIQVFLFSK